MNEAVAVTLADFVGDQVKLCVVVAEAVQVSDCWTEVLLVKFIGVAATLQPGMACVTANCASPTLAVTC